MPGSPRTRSRCTGSSRSWRTISVFCSIAPSRAPRRSCPRRSAPSSAFNTRASIFVDRSDAPNSKPGSGRTSSASPKRSTKRSLNAGMTAAEIDQVFLTGGSSFIPAIQRIFVDRFGADRIASGDQFEFDCLRARPDRAVSRPRRLGRAVGVMRRVGATWRMLSWVEAVLRGLSGAATFTTIPVRIPPTRTSAMQWESKFGLACWILSAANDAMGGQRRVQPRVIQRSVYRALLALHAAVAA